MKQHSHSSYNFSQKSKSHLPTVIIMWCSHFEGIKANGRTSWKERKNCCLFAIPRWQQCGWSLLNKNNARHEAGAGE